MENCLQNFKEKIKGDGELSPIKRWHCGQCSHVEESEAKFAKHLRSHLAGHRARQYRKPEKSKGTEAPGSKDEKISVNTPFIKFDSLSTSQLEISQPNTVTNLMHMNYQNREICEQLVNPSLVMPSKHDDSVENNEFNYTEILNLANIPNHVAIDNGNNLNNNLIMELNGDSCLNLSNEKDINLQILADAVTTDSDINGMHMNIQNLNEENLGTITPLNLYYIDGAHYASTVQNVEITELNEGVSRDNVVILDSSVDKTFRLIDLNGQIVSGNQFEIQPLNDGVKVAQESSDRGMLVCEICQKQFETSAYLYRHLRKHTGEFTCNYCSLSFARKETWLTHRCPGRTKAAENNLHIIPETESRVSPERAADDQQDPDNPESVSTEEPKTKKPKSDPKKDRSVSCLVCGTSLSDNSCLKRHMLTHEKSLCYTCVYCGAVVTHRHSIRRHLRLQHPDYKHEWNNTEFVTSLQTEIKKRSADDPLEPNKNQNTKKKKYGNRKGKDSANIELPTHCPKKDSLLGTTMAEDLKLDFDCHMLQSNKNNSISNQNREFLNNEKSIISVREDSLDLSSFTAHFDEDIGHMSFQALALPDIVCKGSSGDIIKFDSKESSPIKNFNIASLLLLNPGGSKRTAELLPDVSGDQISSKNASKADVKLFPKPKRDTNIFCSPSFFSTNEIGPDKVIRIENYACGTKSDEKTSKGIFLSPVKSDRFDGKFPLMPSMPVLLCEEENAATLQKIDEFNAGMEILLCEPVTESVCPQVDYRSSVLLQEEPNPSCSAGYVLEENSSMQLVDTSTDFTFYVLG